MQYVEMVFLSHRHFNLYESLGSFTMHLFSGLTNGNQSDGNDNGGRMPNKYIDLERQIPVICWIAIACLLVSAEQFSLAEHFG